MLLRRADKLEMYDVIRRGGENLTVSYAPEISKDTVKVRVVRKLNQDGPEGNIQFMRDDYVEICN